MSGTQLEKKKALLSRRNFIVYRCETPASPPQILFKSLLP